MEKDTAIIKDTSLSDVEQVLKEQGREFRAVAARPWFIILLTTALLAGGLLAAFRYYAPLHNPAVNAPQIKQFTPEELVMSLDSRLEHLRSRIPGVGFHIYKIKTKDNLWKLGGRYGYSVHTIIGCNPQLETYQVSIGQKVLLPSQGGTLHTIQKNDTWVSVANRYKLSPFQLQRINANVTTLTPGEMLFIPGKMPDMELMNDSMREKYELRSLFVSPLGGRLSSVFGKRRHPVTGLRSFHGGIDIAVRNNTWVGAAAGGVVTVAGSGVGHYGTAVFIDHENGYVTHYGHLSSVRVRPGQRVKARQLIARSGSTGRVTGPHLHFTILKNGAPKDPLKFIW